MHRLTLAAVGLLLAASGPASAHGLGAAGDLEHARANARAGGLLTSMMQSYWSGTGAKAEHKAPFATWCRTRANSGDYGSTVSAPGN